MAVHPATLSSKYIKDLEKKITVQEFVEEKNRVKHVGYYLISHCTCSWSWFFFSFPVGF
jgi:hypothetical protein